MFGWWSLCTLALLSCVGSVSSTLVNRATTCNGHPELCSRSYGNVSYVGAHDSYAIDLTGPNNLAANQDRNITEQLNDGIRLLQVQAHNNSGVIHLCHTSCALLDGGTLQAYLTTVKTWMDGNPNEVVTLLIVNFDDLPVSAYAPVFVAVGVDTVSYSPSTASVSSISWPTLGTMIDSGKRLVTFIDNAADFATVPYIIDEFTNIWETAYDITDIALFNCQVNRSKNDNTTAMFLINHFLDTVVFGALVPFTAQLNVTNAISGAGSLGQEVSTCFSLWNRYPNFLLVDFYEHVGGSVFAVAAMVNGVSNTYTNTSSSSSSTPSTNHAFPTIGLDWSLVSFILYSGVTVLAFTNLLI